MGRRGRVKQLIRGGIHQDIEAQQVMEAKVPLIIVQFQEDVFCNPKDYSNWSGRILSAVQAPDRARRVQPSFCFLNLPGNHDCAEELATHSLCEDFGPELSLVWHSFWDAVTGD